MSPWISETTETIVHYGSAGLFGLAFAESSFFPVPPDIVLIPLSVMTPEKALWYAFVTTAASVLGGLFAYFIGGKAGRPVLERFLKKERILQVETLFNRYGGWAVLLAAFTPIPYKVFTLASGVFRVNIKVFFLASLLGRGLRFFLESLIVMAMGQAAREFLLQYFNVITLVPVVIVIAAILLKYARQRNKIAD